MPKKRILILGGGFAGIYTALHLERLIRRREDVEAVLVSRENYMVFQPMLAEVLSGNIGILDTVTPIRKLVPHTRLFVRDVQAVDLEGRSVALSPGFAPQPTILTYDHLVVALGNVTDFRRMPGLHDHALPFKNLGDALRLRDHLIHVLGEAANEQDPALRRQLLTFVVAGGGFSGVEVCAELNDFVRRTARKVFRLDPGEIKVLLVHSHRRVLDREMPEQLGLYAQRVMGRRGVEFLFERRLETATAEFAVLDDGRRIPTRTLVSTVPSSPNPLVAAMELPKERGRLRADAKTQAEGTTNVWALGDCATIPNPSGEGVCPPTAQFAIRQAKTCAHNIVATIDGGRQQDFAFHELGKMAALGHRRAIARLFNRINLHGFSAWVFWRMIYWAKLPGLDRKIKVGASWMLDLVCGPELVQTKLDVPRGALEQHFEPDERIISQGDPAEHLYVVTSGKAEARADGGLEAATTRELGPGDCFGATSLSDDDVYRESVRCVEPVTVVAYDRTELGPLWTAPALREGLAQLRSAECTTQDVPS